jgi:hypothetical protein
MASPSLTSRLSRRRHPDAGHSSASDCTWRCSSSTNIGACLLLPSGSQSLMRTASGWIALWSISGGGNRSAYLRATLTVMESLARAERLRDLQARNAERAAAAGQDYETLLAEVRRAYKDGVRQG